MAAELFLRGHRLRPRSDDLMCPLQRGSKMDTEWRIGGRRPSAKRIMEIDPNLKHAMETLPREVEPNRPLLVNTGEPDIIAGHLVARATVARETWSVGRLEICNDRITPRGQNRSTPRSDDEKCWPHRRITIELVLETNSYYGMGPSIPVKHAKEKCEGKLTAEELAVACLYWVRVLQKETFTPDLQTLQRGTPFLN